MFSQNQQAPGTASQSSRQASSHIPAQLPCPHICSRYFSLSRTPSPCHPLPQPTVPALKIPYSQARSQSSIPVPRQNCQNNGSRHKSPLYSIRHPNSRQYARIPRRTDNRNTSSPRYPSVSPKGCFCPSGHPPQQNRRYSRSGRLKAPHLHRESRQSRTCPSHRRHLTGQYIFCNVLPKIGLRAPRRP